MEKARAIFGDEEAPASAKADAAQTIEKHNQTRAERLAELAQWNLEQEAIAQHNKELQARIKRRKADLAAGL